MHLANEQDTSAMNTAASQRLCSQDVLLHLGFAGMSGPRCITLTAREQHQRHLTVKMKLALSCRWPAAAGRQNATGRQRLIVHLVFVKQTTIWGGHLACPPNSGVVSVYCKPAVVHRDGVESGVEGMSRLKGHPFEVGRAYLPSPYIHASA